MAVREFSEVERQSIAKRAIDQFREQVPGEAVTATVEKMSDEDGLPKITFHKAKK